MPKFTKKISGLFNKMGDAKDKAVNSESGPSVVKGSVIGSMGTAGALGAGLWALGIMAIPTGVGLPIIAAGAVAGAVTAKHRHNKKKDSKPDPKPGQ